MGGLYIWANLAKGYRGSAAHMGTLAKLRDRGEKRATGRPLIHPPSGVGCHYVGWMGDAPVRTPDVALGSIGQHWAGGDATRRTKWVMWVKAPPSKDSGQGLQGEGGDSSPYWCGCHYVLRESSSHHGGQAEPC